MVVIPTNKTGSKEYLKFSYIFFNFYTQKMTFFKKMTFNLQSLY